MTAHRTTRSKIPPILMVATASLFYVYEFFLRVIPSSITQPLMHDFHLNAASISLMAACFFYAYAPMQIPAGYLCDRIGPKLAITLAVFLCSLASFGFAQVDHLSTACIMRLIMGASASLAFIGPLTLCAQWIHKKYFALVAGAIQMMGCLGAIFAGQPVVLLQQSIGWRRMTLIAGVIGIGITLLCYGLLQDHPDHRATDSKAHSMQHLKQLFRHRPIYYIGLCGLATWGPIAIFAELWGPSYLATRYQISSAHAAQMMQYIWITIALASPAIGWFSDAIQSRKIPLYLCFSLGLMSTSALVFFNLNMTWLTFCLCMLGLSAAAQPVTFALIKDQISSKMIGTATGFQNMAVISGGVLLQPLTGLILQLTWNHQYIHGIPFYTTHQFQWALVLMPLCGLMGLIITCIKIKEHHH